MGTRSRQPDQPPPPEQPKAPRSGEAFFPTEPMVLLEVVEKDSDSVWAMWNDAVEGGADKDEPPPKDFDTQAATLIMDLQELPKSPDET